MKKLRTSLLLPAELAETTASYLRLIAEAELAEPFIARITTLLTEDLTMLNSAITAVRLNNYVEDVSLADAIRDDLFIGFRDTVDAYARRRDETLLEAYQKIWQLIEKAGTMLYTAGYAEQSGKLEALFAQLDKPTNQEAITLLNATGIYAELKTAQASFTSIYRTRLEADTTIDYPTLRDAKSRIVLHINALLNALYIIHETEPATYDALIEQIDAATAAIMSTARARKSRSTNEEDEEI